MPNEALYIIEKYDKAVFAVSFDGRHIIPIPDEAMAEAKKYSHARVVLTSEGCLVEFIRFSVRGPDGRP